MILLRTLFPMHFLVGPTQPAISNKQVFIKFFYIYFVLKEGFPILKRVSLYRIIAFNKKLGLGMHYEFGWMGVRITPIPGTGKGTPDQSSSAPPKV